jgi:hypothetical protein
MFLRPRSDASRCLRHSKDRQAVNDTGAFIAATSVSSRPNYLVVYRVRSLQNLGHYKAKHGNRTIFLSRDCVLMAVGHI